MPKDDEEEDDCKAFSNSGELEEMIGAAEQTLSKMSKESDKHPNKQCDVNSILVDALYLISKANKRFGRRITRKSKGRQRDWEKVRALKQKKKHSAQMSARAPDSAMESGVIFGHHHTG